MAWAVVAAVLALPGTVYAQAQGPADGAIEDADGTTLEATDQTVKVDGGAGDEAIARRLRGILDASGRYDELTVDVRDGLVFLSGLTDRTDYKAWAADLAQRTEDVVAVVNDIEVRAGPAFDQTPVRREAMELWREFVRSLPLIGLGLVLLLLSLGVARIAGRLFDWPLRALTDSRLLRAVLGKLVSVLVILGGVVLFLRLSGLTAVAATVLGGTGLFGLIVGFAFRDIAENFLASILLSVQTPFRLGDVIEVEGYTGVVQKVTVRGTVLVDFDGNHVQIANATVYKATLKNYTANPNMRIHFVIGIGYDASVKVAQDVIRRLLLDHSAVLDDPEPLVLVDDLGASTINIKVYFWINGHEHSALKMKSSIMRLTLRKVEQAGISLPDEAREIIFPQGVPIAGAGGPGGGQGDAPGVAGGGASGSDDAARRAERAQAIDLADEVTEAEGDLSSEVDEIREQAAASRDVEDGPEIVGDRAER
jgi:small-conductance mechanosensitive channel